MTTEAVPVPCPGLSIHHQRFVRVGGVVVVVQQVQVPWCPPGLSSGCVVTVSGWATTPWPRSGDRSHDWRTCRFFSAQRVLGAGQRFLVTTEEAASWLAGSNGPTGGYMAPEGRSG